MASGLIPGTPVGQLFSRSSQPTTPTLQDIQENNLGGVSSGHAIHQLQPENSQRHSEFVCVSVPFHRKGRFRFRFLKNGSGGSGFCVRFLGKRFPQFRFLVPVRFLSHPVILFPTFSEQRNRPGAFFKAISHANRRSSKTAGAKPRL